MVDEQKTPIEDSSKSEDEDYKEAADSTADYADHAPHKERSPIWRKLGISAVVLIAVIVLGGGIYWLVSGQNSNKKTSQSTQSQNTAPVASKIETTTKHYDSSNFNLGFDYPADWTVSDDSENGILTVKSPATNLKDSDSQNTNARITMLIRPNTSKLTEFDSGNAISALDSEKIAYTKPTQAQRANTYLSFLRYANSTDGMNGVYITSDNGYKKAQAIPKVDIQKSDPVISVVFSLSDGKTQLSISIDNWDDSSFSDPIKSMLQSFTIN